MNSEKGQDCKHVLAILFS